MKWFFKDIIEKDGRELLIILIFVLIILWVI